MLGWMEQSMLGQFMRDSSLWTYPIVNLLHIFGIAALFGATLIIDLRLLGMWRAIPLGSIAEVAVPVATAGFTFASVTGVALLATKATEYANNPYVMIKFAAIGFGVVNVLALHWAPAWRARAERPPTLSDERRLAVFGGISLTCWITAVTAGRLIAYW